ncbi:MAG: putative bifunctional diguanylate cyclase/phosphodiesterase, partial [Cyanobium sp.]
LLLLQLDGSPKLVYSAPGHHQATYRALIRCAQETQGRLPTVQSTLRLVCVADNGRLYLGTATPVSNNTSTAPPAGTLVLFDPLIRQEYRPVLRQRIATLRRDLRFVSGSRPPDPGLELIMPPIHSSEGRLLAMRRPDPSSVIARLAREDLPLLVLIPLFVFGLRMGALLARRHQRVLERQAERQANGRVRRACRELDRLLEDLLPEGAGDGDAGRLLGCLRQQSEVPSAGGAPLPGARADSFHDRELDRVTGRIQRFLRSASTLALIDPLTQLPNRRYCIAQMAETAKRYHRSGRHFALLFIDVDKFKVINDTYGHTVGDGVLVIVCQRLRSVLQDADFMARYGGDELAVILDLSSLDDQSPNNLNRAARDRAQAMIDTLMAPVQVGDLPIAVSLSIGVTLVDPSESDVNAMIQRSDLAMYQAKRSRSGRIVGPEEAVSLSQLSNYELFTDLIQAIRCRQMQIFFQPIVAAGGRPHGMEALARWHHPQRGWIPPVVFLEMAEQHRQIQLLGHELIRLSLEGFEQLHRQDPSLRFYLNLAPNQLLKGDLADRLLAHLQARTLPADCLTLELTEHSILEPHPVVLANLEALRQAGMHLALDDFGTGYSSLVLLKTLRPDVVKIDKSFIQAIRDDADALHIITLIAGLAPRLGLELIAEGIEDLSALPELESLGIQYFQGYAFGRPGPLQDWLAADGAAGSVERRAIV